LNDTGETGTPPSRIKKNASGESAMNALKIFAALAALAS
jgi:hypothetical protein